MFMPRVSAVARRFDNLGNAQSARVRCAEILDRQHRPQRELQKLLSAGHANYHGGDIFRIDERVEIFCARQIRKMDDVVGHLRDFASELFSRSQV
jgi:hypothetical protein